MLAQRLKLNCLGLPVAILEQSLGLLLSESFLIFKLHELLILRRQSTLCIGQVTSILGNGSGDALETGSCRWR